MQHKPLVRDMWETIAEEAERESALWGAALRGSEERERIAVFSPLADERFALGLETIYEGYLLHYGRPRLFAAGDADARILLGDYLYAHGLVRVSSLGDVAVVADLAELLSLCAQLRAEPRRGSAVPDGVVWAASVAALGSLDGRLESARGELRERGDPAALGRLAEEAAGADAVAQALAVHAQRLD